MRPPRLFQAGDGGHVEIESFGYIENRLIAEPDDTARIG